MGGWGGDLCAWEGGGGDLCAREGEGGCVKEVS